MNEELRREARKILAMRELSRRHYSDYLAYVNGKMWIKTRFSTFIANTVQEFIETDTGNAYDILIIESPPQHGKLVADDVPVFTKSGWKRHGDLRIGDEVVSLDGKFVKVVNVLPKYFADREVTFTNGEKVQVHHNHEWVVHSRIKKRRVCTEETGYLQKHLSYGKQKRIRGHRYNFQLPIKEALDSEDIALKVVPYVLGAWLGDGTNRKNCICACDNDKIVLEECSKYYTVSSRNVHKTTGVITWYFDGLRQALNEYGMCYSTRATDKHIPFDYLKASKRQRLELLAGLIDTDGYADLKHNRIVFTTADAKLKDTFVQLVATFGWRTTVCTCKPFVSSSGIVGKREYWQIGFNPTEPIPCRVQRKQMTRFSKQRKISFSEIKEIEPVQGNCITVEGGIYCIGESMIPTHNSMTVTEALPSWYLGKYPDNRVIEVSYNADTAERFGRSNKDKVAEHGKQLFGIEVGSISKADEFNLSGHRGQMLSRGIMAGITGNPANLMLIDDPIKTREEADSEGKRSKIWGEWLSSIKTRLAAGAKVILIMTPWHEDDLRARILATEQNVRRIRIPVEAEDGDELGRLPGEPLCPEIGKDDRWLAQFKASYLASEEGGARAWSALYMCNPVIEGGNIVQRTWWKYYDPAQLTQFATEVISIDATFKDTKNSDYVAIQVWGKLEGNYYLRYNLNRRMDFPTTVKALLLVKSLYPRAFTILIEDKANGSAIIQTLQQEYHLTGVLPVNPKGGKVARVNAVSPAIESGHVFLPLGAPWLEDYLRQWSEFPAGKHDDMVDATSQCLNRMIYNSGIIDLPVEQDYVALMAKREQDAFLGEQMWSPYDRDTDYVFVG